MAPTIALDGQIGLRTTHDSKHTSGLLHGEVLSCMGQLGASAAHEVLLTLSPALRRRARPRAVLHYSAQAARCIGAVPKDLLHHVAAPLTVACMPLHCRAKQAQVQANSTAQSFSKDASQKTKQAGQRAQNAVPQANGRK